MIAHFADLFIFQQLPVVKREPHPFSFHPKTIQEIKDDCFFVLAWISTLQGRPNILQ